MSRRIPWGLPIAAAAVAMLLGAPLWPALSQQPARPSQPRRPFLPRFDPAPPRGSPRPVARRPSSAPRDVPADQEQEGEEIDGGGGGGEVGAPSPEWARTVEVQLHGAPVRAGPDDQSERRGQVARGARFPLLARRLGQGCEGGPWYRIGEAAWICADYVWLSANAPAARAYPGIAEAEVVPFRYAFSAVDGTRAYARPSDIDIDDYVETLARGWGLAIVARRSHEGQTIVRTTRGTWIQASELRWARPSEFAGARLAEVREGMPIPVAWVRRGGASTYTTPGDRRRVGTLPGRAMVQVGDEVREGTRSFTRLGDGRYVETRLLVRPERIAPPAGVGPTDRWIDVHLAQQTLVAYQGTEPVFTTLVSTGRRAGSTPRGTHRIWIKMALGTMDNVEDEEAVAPYSMDGVPWIQYFAEDVALHAVYWHDRFGTVRSHGCVNLSPRDARWLYAFTSPTVPDGWTVTLPTARDRGTVVHVR
ncbi:MAG: L,D-transpeptidase family protein [Deltaproteobacteria bacterium]|nr:L,D-transpeptidase family protein [Deltaproteobacteria bacterium]